MKRGGKWKGAPVVSLRAPPSAVEQASKSMGKWTAEAAQDLACLWALHEIGEHVWRRTTVERRVEVRDCEGSTCGGGRRWRGEWSGGALSASLAHAPFPLPFQVFHAFDAVWRDMWWRWDGWDGEWREVPVNRTSDADQEAAVPWGSEGEGEGRAAEDDTLWAQRLVEEVRASVLGGCGAGVGKKEVGGSKFGGESAGGIKATWMEDYDEEGEGAGVGEGGEEVPRAESEKEEEEEAGASEVEDDWEALVDSDTDGCVRELGVNPVAVESSRQAKDERHDAAGGSRSLLRGGYEDEGEGNCMHEKSREMEEISRGMKRRMDSWKKSKEGRKWAADRARLPVSQIRGELSIHIVVHATW